MLLFNRYEYDAKADLIGRGGFSRVYKAKDNKLNRWVALKIYKTSDLAERYSPIAEIQRVINLEHPNICRYIDIEEFEKEDAFGEKEKIQVCVLELLDAGNLSKYYQVHKDLSIFKKLLLDVLQGLAYLHRNSIIHRDIKPANILIKQTVDGPIAKITDFGISKRSDSSGSSSSSALIVSIPYMAPEQLNAQKYGINSRVSYNIDFWSLGVTVFETLSGEILFKNNANDSSEQIMINIMNPDVPEKINTLPQPFRNFVSACIVKDAKERIKSAEELMSILMAPVDEIEKEQEKVKEEEREVEDLLAVETREVEIKGAEQSASGSAIDEHQPVELLPASTEKVIVEVPENIEDSEDTRILSKKWNTIDKDETRILPKDWKNAPAGNEELEDTPQTTAESGDETKILSKNIKGLFESEGINTETTDEKASDETQLLEKIPQDDVDETRVLKSTTPEDDETRVITTDMSSEFSDAETTLLKPQSISNDNIEDETQLLNIDEKDDETQILDQPMETEASKDEIENAQDVSKAETTEPILGKKEKPVNLFNRYDYYPVHDMIGKGGFSRVYKAYDNKLSRWVALKIYKTGEFSDRYSPIAEIKRVVNLDHANICRYLDIEEIQKENPFGENEKIQVCVMELLDGGNFAEYFRNSQSPDVLKKLLRDVLNGLAYLHKKGIIHRDIKPANILIKETVDGPVAKITDFGISKASDTMQNNTNSALIVSIPYMAPEQLNVKRYGMDEKISYNLDLWSFGVTLYEVITGKVLFKNSDQDSSEQIMTNIMAPELPDKINELPEPFRNIVKHCVIKNAKERVQRAEDLIPLLTPPDPVIDVLQEPEFWKTAALKKRSSLFVSEEKTDIPTEKINKPRLWEDDPEIQAEATPASRRGNYLIIAGIAAVLVIVPVLLFSVFRNERPSIIIPPKSNTLQAKADTSSKTAAAMAGTTNVKKEKDTVVNKPAEKTETASKSKSTTPAAKKEDKPVTPKPGSKYSLTISTEATCTLTMTNLENNFVRDHGTITPGISIAVRLPRGKYILKATNTQTGKVFTARVDVKAENLGKDGKFRIRF